MSKKQEIPKNVINPFSEAFLDMWDLWKQYKNEQFKFKYKGCISEQAALMQLATISGNDEGVACEIIKQSMANGWRGLFMLKNNKNGNTKAPTREDVNTEFAGRNYSNR